MARSLARSQRSRRHANAPLSRRSLRVEHLEPRLVLSAALTLSPSADAYVNAAAPTANYGNAADLLVENSANHFTSNECDAYLKFDLTGISGPVTKAVLNLTPLAVGAGASSITIGVQLLKDGDDGWVEGSGGTNRSWTGPITWMNSPDGYGQIVTLSASQLSASTPIAIDVTQLINQKFNVNGISSFVIGVISPPGGFGPSRPGAAWSVDFASRENPNAAFRPTLTVTAATTDPPPTVATQPIDRKSNEHHRGPLGAGRRHDRRRIELDLYLVGHVARRRGRAHLQRQRHARLAEHHGHFPPGRDVRVHGENHRQDRRAFGHDQLRDGDGGPDAQRRRASAPPASPWRSAQRNNSRPRAWTSSARRWRAGTVTWSASKARSAPERTRPRPPTSPPARRPPTRSPPRSGSFSATAAVTVVQSNYLGLLNPDLASLTQSLDADGSINRADMIQILDCVESESERRGRCRRLQRLEDHPEGLVDVEDRQLRAGLGQRRGQRQPGQRPLSGPTAGQPGRRQFGRQARRADRQVVLRDGPARHRRLQLRHRHRRHALRQPAGRRTPTSSRATWATAI